MPFTFSHPAIVLPLTYLPRNWVSISGLVIGSVTPDFEYFIRMRVLSIYSHAVEGIIWPDLPLAILLTFIFHNFVRDALIHNLPAILRSRFIRYDQFDWNDYFKRRWYVVIISILLGIASHIFWDGFTHETGYFVETFPLLGQTCDFFTNQISIFKLLQHSSTLVGGLIIAVLIFKLPIQQDETHPVDPMYWVLLFAVSAVILIMRFVVGLELTQYGNVIVSVITAMILGMILTPQLLKIATALKGTSK